MSLSVCYDLFHFHYYFVVNYTVKLVRFLFTHFWSTVTIVETQILTDFIHFVSIKLFVLYPLLLFGFMTISYFFMNYSLIYQVYLCCFYCLFINSVTGSIMKIAIILMIFSLFINTFGCILDWFLTGFSIFSMSLILFIGTYSLLFKTFRL